MTRVVLDTNLFVGSAYNADSASRQILDACFQGKLTAVFSSAIQREYERIVPRAVRRKDSLEPVNQFLSQAERVEPEETPRIIADDPDDDKFLAAAVAGQAEAIVSNDQHLLELGTYERVVILRPSEFVQKYLESD